ncbi:MAG: hypothetical protein KGJ06_06980 [Pseudomonadota bacterium]|nr:hypothetical protein [Pseudomonadota bacterium]
MAINANTVWEVRPTNGSDSNGGGFCVGLSTTDISTSATLAIDASNNKKVTSSAHNFVSGDVGKYIKVTAGTGWATGWYQIVSTASNAAILDHSPSAAGNGSNGTYSLYSGIDYSQQNSAQVAINNSTVTCTTTGANSNTLTFTAGYTPSAADVGNIVQLTGGTNINSGFYQITAQTSTTWTLSGATNATTAGGPGSAVTGDMGGALKSITKPAVPTSAGNKVFVKAESTIQTASSLTLPGSGSITPSHSTPYLRFIGYSSTRGDGGRVTIQLITNTGLTALTQGVSGTSIENFIIDCNSLGTSQGISFTANHCRTLNCLVKNFTKNGIISTGSAIVEQCEVTAGTSAATAAINLNGGSAQLALNNYVHDNACPGITSAGTNAILFNIVDNNSGSTSDGILISGIYSNIILFNTVNRSGRHNINLNSTGYETTLIKNNILAAAGGSTGTNAGTAYGLQSSAAALPADTHYDGNAYYNNLTANRNNMDDGTTNAVNGIMPYVNSLDVALSASPFTNVAGQDYSLNATSGGGASARYAGAPASWPGASTSGYADMGAAQSKVINATVGYTAS